MPINSYTNDDITLYNINLPSSLSEFFSPNACPDQHIGYLNFKSGSTSLNIRNNIDYDFVNNKIMSPGLNYPLIVLLLESPHIYEFDIYTKEAIGPANGKTGANLIKFLVTAIKKCSKLNRKINSQIYDVVLINSIQFQTSLGEPTVKNRNKVWLKLWKETDIKNDITNRLSCLAPDILINLVTGGKSSKYTLNNRITNHLKNGYLNSNNTVYAAGKHPSCWHYKKYKTNKDSRINGYRVFKGKRNQKKYKLL